MNKWIRQIHRWLSIIFTLTVIANIAVMAQGAPPAWVTYSPLPPLFLLMFTGLYMFFLPYTRWAGAHAVESRNERKSNARSGPAPEIGAK